MLYVWLLNPIRPGARKHTSPFGRVSVHFPCLVLEVWDRLLKFAHSKVVDGRLECPDRLFLRLWYHLPAPHPSGLRQAC